MTKKVEQNTVESGIVDRIIAYEQGALDAIDTVKLYSDLIKSGHLSHFQGFYQRTAEAMRKAGILNRLGEIDIEMLEEATGIPLDYIEERLSPDCNRGRSRK